MHAHATRTHPRTSASVLHAPCPDPPAPTARTRTCKRTGIHTLTHLLDSNPRPHKIAPARCEIITHFNTWKPRPKLRMQSQMMNASYFKRSQRWKRIHYTTHTRTYPRMHTHTPCGSLQASVPVPTHTHVDTHTHAHTHTNTCTHAHHVAHSRQLSPFQYTHTIAHTRMLTHTHHVAHSRHQFPVPTHTHTRTHRHKRMLTHTPCSSLQAAVPVLTHTPVQSWVQCT